MPRHRLLSLSPVKITAVYLVFGLTWIATTDWLVITLVDSPQTVSLLQTIKGWIFVLVSAALILGLTRLRATQIEQAQSKLERASEQVQVLNRFLRHNIRNDVTVIRGNIQLVEEHLEDSKKQACLKTARSKAETIDTTSEKMRIVDQVDLSSTSTDTEIDLVDVTTREIESVRENHPSVTIDVDAPDDAPIYAEPSIRYAIAELLENAIDHNTNPPEACEIGVTIRRENGTITLDIKDNGPGIPESELEALQAKEETDLMHMSGVGLWLTSWLTEYVGGGLDIGSGTDEGTTVTLQFEAVGTMPGFEDLSGGVIGRQATG